MTQDKDSQSDKPGSESGKKPRRVAKTMLETDVDVSAVLKAAKELDQAAHAGDAAHTAPGAQHAGSQVTSQSRVPVVETAVTEPTVQPEASAQESVAAAAQSTSAAPPAAKPEKKRRVAKTLLFGIGTASEDIHEGGLHQEQAAAQSPTSETASAGTASGISGAAAQTAGGASPTAGTAAPTEKKTTQSNRKPIRKIAKTLVFNEVDEFTDSGIHSSLSADAGQGHSLYHTLAVESTHAAPTHPDLGLVHSDRVHADPAHAAPVHSDPAHSGPVASGAAPSGQASTGEAGASEANALSAAPAETTKKRRRGAGQYVAKTMLDQSVLAETVLKSVAKLEVRVKEELKERANEPVKPFVPVACDKVTLPCAWSWTETGTAKRFKVCDLCQKNVYDFTDMEMPEAEKLIFQRENLETFTLYKRPDGKYMTSDCPLQVKRKSDFNMMIAVGIAVAVAIVVLLSMLPHQPKTAAKPAPGPEEPGTETHISKVRKIDHSSIKPDEHGTYHYRSDEPAPVQGAAGTTPTQSGSAAPAQTGGATAIFPEPAKPQGPAASQEGGDFWVNPDGGTNGSDTVITAPMPSSRQGAGR